MLYLLRYDEIALKSEPVRRRWENVLIKNIKQALECRVKKERGRIWVEAGEEARSKLKKIFGIRSFSSCVHCGLDGLEETFLNFAEKSLEGKKSFALRVRRTGKHAFTSQDIARKLGAKVQEKSLIKVELKNPEREIFVEIRDNDCYIFDEIIEGPGGLPLGVEGKVVVLISGGIDSPVAAWLMMKRGCEVVALFMNPSPLVDERTVNRAMRAVEKLAEWKNAEIKTYVAPYGSVLIELLKAGSKLGCVLCKRMMYRVAELAAEKEGAKAIVTGESLGQVASQTLDNLSAIDAVTTLPVFRPLIGMDKAEIVELAKKIGTYEISILPANCCLGPPLRPATKASLEKVERTEAQLDVEKLARDIFGKVLRKI
ncbi:MAG: tRNA 4-thiouridine(8) synthase ThiI [Euryarchaeota archaeon]|nr:tRNA 4-thiouridine(8) synthase ThiI [Euryarchaeota archaeon]